MFDPLKQQVAVAAKTLRQRGSGQVQFWLIALVIGVAAGAGTLGFRRAISFLQAQFYGADDVMLASAARDLPWALVLVIPIFGGLIVGLILHFFTPDGRSRTVAHVIEGAALNDGRIEGRAGLASTLASLVTLSTGGSTGREGPAVQIGALISSKVSRWINADGITGRELMGCAVAAAVSASFNAPIAGTIFALEVVLRHFAIHAFAPIAIAAVAGTVVSRLEFGNITEFTLPAHTSEFYVELPAYLLLGILCGLVAVVMIKSIFWAEDIGDRVQSATNIPGWARPAVSGAMLGGIAIFFPHIIGVGYETTSDALTGRMVLHTAILFAVVKVAAVAITMAGRMGGGVFSPALMLGALTGLAFGWVATMIFPAVEGDETLYALAGMGAVAAAVLGAPISTSLIVFEMTGDWQAGLAVMVAVSMSTAIASRLVKRSFFLTQLARRGVHIADGPSSYLMSTIHVRNILRPASKLKPTRQAKLWKQAKAGSYVDVSATLDQVMPMFKGGKVKYLPVVRIKNRGGGLELMGGLSYTLSLKAYNTALAEMAREEHS